MGTLMFVFGGIAAPLAGLGRRNDAENEPRDGHLFLLALLLGLSQTARRTLSPAAVIKYSRVITALFPAISTILVLFSTY